MLTSRSARALRAVLLLVLACALLGLPTLATAAAPGHADRDARAAATADALERAVTGKVRGAITGSQQGTPKALMSWFSDDWRFLGKRKVDNGLYSLSLPVGTYHLQFTDRRPAYDVTKYAPVDLTVRVKRSPTQRNVHFKRGAAITGTVTGRGKPLRHGRLAAARADGVSFEVDANKKGQFALAGLPEGKYSLFTWDDSGTFVGPSRYLGTLRTGQILNEHVNLRKRSGKLLVSLYTVGKQPLSKQYRPFLTIVSKRTGQWWTARARNGEAAFTGLFPGKYYMVAPGVGNFLPVPRGAVSGARVRSGKVDLASTFTWVKRGATITGTVVDQEHPDVPLEGARVRLFDSGGHKVATVSSNATACSASGGS